MIVPIAYYTYTSEIYIYIYVQVEHTAIGQLTFRRLYHLIASRSTVGHSHRIFIIIIIAALHSQQSVTWFYMLLLFSDIRHCENISIFSHRRLKIVVYDRLHIFSRFFFCLSTPKSS